MEIFIEYFGKSFPKVIELYLSDYPIPLETFKDLCDTLSDHNLYHVGFSDAEVGPAGIKYLSKELVSMNNLSTLVLNGNNMGYHGAIALSKALAKLCQLRTINIAKNNITITGALAIADALCHHKKLADINMDGINILIYIDNDIEDTGLKEILSSLVNEKVTNLSFAGNLITDRGCQMISNYLKKNKNVLSLDLSRNKITESGVSLLCCRIVEYPSMKSFIINSILLNNF